MKRLGYERYGAQGGDWGAFVSPELGRVDPDHVIGVHINAATMGFIPFGPVGAEDLATFTHAEKLRLERLNNFMADGNGYFQIQATRPQTLAYGLTDSQPGSSPGSWRSSRNGATPLRHWLRSPSIVTTSSPT